MRRGAEQFDEVSAGRIAPGADAPAIQPVLGGVGAQPAHGGLAVVQVGRELAALVQQAVIKLLIALARRAYVNVKDSDGNTTIIIAERKSRTKIAEYLKSKGDKK